MEMLFSTFDMAAEAAVVEEVQAAIAKQQHIKHVFTATNQHATTVEPLEVVFSTQYVPRLQQGLMGKFSQSEIEVDGQLS